MKTARATLMNCRELASQIESLQPDAAPQDVARLCLLLTTSVDDVGQLSDSETLNQAWHDAGMRLKAATDQHAAMTQELEDLANSDPRSFTQDQIWVLIRAIKVQSQILGMYIGQAALDV